MSGKIIKIQSNFTKMITKRSGYENGFIKFLRFSKNFIPKITQKNNNKRNYETQCQSGGIVTVIENFYFGKIFKIF